MTAPWRLRSAFALALAAADCASQPGVEARASSSAGAAGGLRRDRELAFDVDAWAGSVLPEPAMRDARGRRRA